MAGISSNLLSYPLTLDEAPSKAISKSASGMAMAAIALGAALQVNFGQYHPASLALLMVALVSATLALLRNSLPPAMTILSAGLVIQTALLLIWNPMATLVVTSAATLLPFRIGIVIGCILAIRAIHHDSRAALFCLLGVHFLLGLWVLHVAPIPKVDVAMFQKEAARALLARHNPYAMTFVNPYADAARVYGPGTFANGRLLFGYPYPPLTLLMVLPGHLLGDFRLMQLVATTLAGGLIAFARPGRIATAAAALFLSTPRGFFVLEAGWTEPLLVVLLAAVIFFACRDPRWTFLAAAMLLISKQYLIFALPLLIVLMPWLFKDRRRVVIAAIVAAAVSLPLVMWDVPAFMHSVVTLQFHQPMRADALSFLPWTINLTGLAIPGWIGLFMAVGAVVIALQYCPKSPAGFATAIAFVFLIFFATNKQAFCNYYHFVIGAMCCAIAASQPDESAGTRSAQATQASG
jgi:hypothetical protein